MARDDGSINWVQVLAAAGAAVSSAVLLSTLGVGGTIIGAALGSIAASIATHAYSRGLHLSREQALALRRISQAREDLDRAAVHPDQDQEAGLEHADQVLGRVEASLTARRPGWRQVAVVAAALFVGAMVAITAFELVTGRAVSTYTGGSDKDTRVTVPGVKDQPTRQQSPTPTPSPTATVTVTQAPTGTPSGSPTETPSETPNETPSKTPSETLTLPTPTLTPTGSATP